MAHKVTLKNGSSFSADTDKTIFNSALESGITLDHSCLMARCMSCKAKVLKGSYEKINDETVLSDVERNQGYILTCNTIPKSDLKLDIEDLGDIELYPPRTLPCKIHSMEIVADGIMKLVLRLPPRSDFKFLAGQYVNLIKGNIKRSYSISSISDDASKLEFYIKKYESGKMSSYLFGSAKENDLLRLEGPHGTFFLRNNSFAESIIFLATGTGIAPVKAILEQLSKERKNLETRILLLWGGRQPDDFFWKPNFDFETIDYMPTLSRENSKWTGEKGYIQYVLLNKLNDFSKVEVYACGSNTMINDAKKLLVKNGLPENKFYSDAFVNSN